MTEEQSKGHEKIPEKPRENFENPDKILDRNLEDYPNIKKILDKRDYIGEYLNQEKTGYKEKIEDKRRIPEDEVNGDYKEKIEDKRQIKRQIPEYEVGKRELTAQEIILLLRTGKISIRDRERFLQLLERLEPTQTAPQAETFSAAEQAEELNSMLESMRLTTDIVYDMMINAYSHLRKGDYETAGKQLRILKSVNLARALDGDEESQEVAIRAISDLEGKL